MLLFHCKAIGYIVNELKLSKFQKNNPWMWEAQI